MIKRIYSTTLKTFKTIEFKQGFNFLVSNSVDGKSNNGTGKTSLIQIINFCLGSNKEKIAEYEVLKEHAFSLEIELYGKEITLTRYINNSSKIIIKDLEGLLDNECINDEEKTLDWTKEKLNTLIFGMKENEISFRTLISPFMKRGNSAFNSIFKTHTVENSIRTQLKNAYFMDISIEPILELKKQIEERESFIKLKEIKESDLIWKKEKVSSLKSKIKNLKESIEENEARLKNFELTLSDKDEISNIQYINKRLTELIKEKYLCINKIESNKKLIKNEAIFTEEQIKEILLEAEFFVSKDNIKTISEIQKYHYDLNILRNERVENLIKENSSKLMKINEQIEKMNSEKIEILKKFDKRGYLDEYYSISEIITSEKIEKSDLEKQYEVYSTLDEVDKQCKEKIKKIIEKMKSNLQQSNHNSVSNKFADYIMKVFGEQAKLIVECQEKGKYESRGYSFDWEIPKKLSSGYLKGCIAVYDLALSDYNCRRFPISLVHDSVVFESTDKQYVAKFLNLVYSVIEKNRFQYICCVNDDQIITNDLNSELIQIYNDSPKLSQKDSLFGIEFGKR